MIIDYCSSLVTYSKVYHSDINFSFSALNGLMHGCKRCKQIMAVASYFPAFFLFSFWLCGDILSVVMVYFFCFRRRAEAQRLLKESLLVLDGQLP